MRTKGNTIYPKRRILFSKRGCPLPVRSNFALAKLVISAAVTRRRSGVCTINPCLSLSMYVIRLRMCVMDSSGTGIGLFSIIAASDFRGETLMRSVSSLSIRFIASLGRSEERGIVCGRCRWAWLETSKPDGNSFLRSSSVEIGLRELSAKIVLVLKRL